MQHQEGVYTRGPIGRTMLKTAFSMLAGTLAMSGYNIVDTYFVGQLGKLPLAAMGFTFPVIMLVGCIFRGLCVGVMTPAAQALGKGQHERAVTVISSGLLLITLCSFVMALLGMGTGRFVFALMGAKGIVLDEVLGYMDIWYFGCVTSFVGMAGNDLLISSGASKTASGMMVFGLFLNAVMDPIFINGWGPVAPMGIRGAALATLGAQFVSAFLCLAILHGRLKLLEFRKLPFRELRSSWMLIIRFALPSSLGMLMMPIGSAIITWITARFGNAAVAAAAAAGRLEMLAFVFPMALGMSLMPMVGQNFGARLYSRIREIRKFSMRFAGGFLFCMAILYFFFADVLVNFFSPDPEVRRIMAQCLRITSWGFGCIEIHRFGGFCFTGCGRPAVSAFLNGFRMVGLMIPFSLGALYFHSLEGLFWARLASDLISGTMAILMARHLVNHLPEDGVPVVLKNRKNA